LNSIWRPEEETYVRNMLSFSFVGDVDTVRKNMLDFQKVVKMDELIISVPQYDHAAKLKTIEMARGIFS
jgi:alkanesulfonate monooxygenase SsuD/methylene tetrahydromethanopterin reductase-like flavin-dependent oxidoreductase (luciferase family)